MGQDYYTVLSLTRSANDADIKKAYVLFVFKNTIILISGVQAGLPQGLTEIRISGKVIVFALCLTMFWDLTGPFTSFPDTTIYKKMGGTHTIVSSRYAQRYLTLVYICLVIVLLIFMS